MRCATKSNASGLACSCQAACSRDPTCSRRAAHSRGPACFRQAAESRGLTCFRRATHSRGPACSCQAACFHDPACSRRAAHSHCLSCSSGFPSSPSRPKTISTIRTYHRTGGILTIFFHGFDIS
ncbi:hypothetical protein COP2_028100 [Malus domestica]